MAEKKSKFAGIKTNPLLPLLLVLPPYRFFFYNFPLCPRFNFAKKLKI